MGNALQCPDSRLFVPGDEWICNGDTLPASCQFPFMAVHENHSVVYQACVPFEAALPPANATSIRFNPEPQAYWCSQLETLSAANAAEAVSICSCVPSGSGAEKEADNVWLLGVGFSILSSVATTVGTLLQKISHRINDAKPPGMKAPEIGGILFSPAWMGAFALMVILPLPFDFIALALAAQSLLVVFAGLTIALNVPAARIMLGERPDRLEKIATVVILLGLVCTTSSGPKEDVDANACQLLERYQEADFRAAVGMLAASIAIILYFAHWAPSSPLILRLRPILYAYCAGGFGGLGNIAFKATGELAQAGLAESSRNVGAWKTIHPYYHIVVCLVLSIAQISHINQGLKRYNAVLFVPLYNCMYIILSGTMGAVTYREFDKYTTVQWVIFPLGVCITLVGIIIMGMKDPSSATQEEAKVAPALPELNDDRK